MFAAGRVGREVRKYPSSIGVVGRTWVKLKGLCSRYVRRLGKMGVFI
jgi:hypothetical protein